MDMWLISTAVIYNLLIIHPASGNSLNSTFKEKVFGFLQELCPGSGVCSNENRTNLSCCSACSCASDCNGANCCFPKQPDNQTNGTKYPSKRSNSQCLYPLSDSQEIPAHMRALHQAYYMVASSSSEQNSSMVPCGDMRVASWGSMYPVSSRTDGTIYKNRFCAEENNVTEWDLWDAYLVCDDSYASSTASVYSGVIPDECNIQFGHDDTLLRSEMCYVLENYHNYCSNNEFRIPSITTASKEEIIAACTSGIMSPYKEFTNVFCSICHGRRLETCSEGIHDGFGGIGGASTFISILDPYYLDRYHETEPYNVIMQKYTGSFNTACIVNDDPKTTVAEGCRRIACSAGQIYDDTNMCIYPGNTWVIDRIMMHLDLTANQPFSIAPLLASIRNLKSPFSKDWHIEMVRFWYEEDSKGVIAVLQTLQLQTTFQPATLLKRLREVLMKPWLLVTSNGTISLNAHIHHAPYPRMPDINVYGLNDLAFRSAFPITLLYFCDQIVLQPWEYVYNYVEDTLTNLLTNDTLTNAGFTWIESVNGAAPIVCLHTSGLQRMPTSTAQTTVPRTVICLILALCQLII